MARKSVLMMSILMVAVEGLSQPATNETHWTRRTVDSQDHDYSGRTGELEKSGAGQEGDDNEKHVEKGHDWDVREEDDYNLDREKSQKPSSWGNHAVVPLRDKSRKAHGKAFPGPEENSLARNKYERKSSQPTSEGSKNDRSKKEAKNWEQLAAEVVPEAGEPRSYEKFWKMTGSDTSEKARLKRFVNKRDQLAVEANNSPETHGSGQIPGSHPEDAMKTHGSKRVASKWDQLVAEVAAEAQNSPPVGISAALVEVDSESGPVKRRTVNWELVAAEAAAEAARNPLKLSGTWSVPGSWSVEGGRYPRELTGLPVAFSRKVYHVKKWGKFAAETARKNHL